MGVVAICPYLASVKFLGKRTAKFLVQKFLFKLTGAFATILRICLGVSINFSAGSLGNLIYGNAWCLSSVGGMVGLVADYFSDRKIDGYIRF